MISKILGHSWILLLSLSMSPLAAAEIGKPSIHWQIALSGNYSTGTAIAPDGTIYITDTSDRLHSISAEGHLNWSIAAGKHPRLGPDGTIYVGNTQSITALTPSGTIKWKFNQNPGALAFFGPEVGPDGNIYGVATQGLGPFSLTPEGTLRWSGTETYQRPNTADAQLVFGYNGNRLQLYYYANRAFSAIDTTDGARLAGFPGGTAPLTAPDGTLHSGTKAYFPNGQLRWNASLPAAFATLMEIDSAGNTFYGEFSTKIHSVSSNGTFAWTFKLPVNNYLNGLRVDPTRKLILFTATGKSGTYLQALDSVTLEPLWQQDFGSLGGDPVVGSIAGFNNDGSSVYVTASGAGHAGTFDLYSVSTRN